MRIVLASSSQSRAALLAAAGVAVEVIPSDLDEDAVKAQFKTAPPEELALTLAEKKAVAISTLRPKDLVIGGDQILWFENSLISKCADLEEARSLLLRLRGKVHELIGGLAIAMKGQIVWRHASRVRMTFRSFSTEFLDQYLAEEGPQVLASVGAYRLEGRGAQLVERFEGSYFSVLGLDLLPLLAALRARSALPT